MMLNIQRIKNRLDERKLKSLLEISWWLYRPIESKIQDGTPTHAEDLISSCLNRKSFDLIRFVKYILQTGQLCFFLYWISHFCTTCSICISYSSDWKLLVPFRHYIMYIRAAMVYLPYSYIGKKRGQLCITAWWWRTFTAGALKLVGPIKTVHQKVFYILHSLWLCLQC